MMLARLKWLEKTANKALNVDVWSSGICVHSPRLIIAHNHLHSTRLLAWRYTSRGSI